MPSAERQATSIPADRWRTIGIVIILIGCALRLAYAYPVHKYAADADCLNVGLRAFRILEGAHPVFHTSARNGCFECYEQAVAFSLFGISRASLALAPLLAGCLLLVVFFFLLRRVLDGATASLALLFLALPSPAYIFWTYMPNIYPETMLFGAGTLWLTSLVADRGLGGGRGFALGLVAGWGWWNSALTLTTLIPSVLWLLWLRRDLLRQRRLVGLSLIGFLLGASPWIAYNLRHRFASFQEDLVVGQARGLRSVVSNTAYLLSRQIPELVASQSLAGPGDFSTRGQELLRILVIAIDGAALLFGATAFVRWLIRAVKRGGDSRPPPWALLLLVLPVNYVLYVFSEAGTRREFPVRYVFPSYFSIIVLLALFIAWIARRSRRIAMVLPAVILAFNLMGYAFWWTPQRISWRQGLEADRRLLTFLESNKIQVVCGNYWLSYPLNFLSREKILGISDDLSVDPYDYFHKLGNQPLRWALIANTDLQLHIWVARAKLTGAFAHPTPEYFLFVPDPAFCQKDPWGFLIEILTALRGR